MTLAAINKRAQEIREKNPEIKWQAALKQAGAELKANANKPQAQPSRLNRAKRIAIFKRP